MATNVGIAIATLHLVTFMIMCFVAYRGEPMSEFILLIWLPIDFPLSIPVICAHQIYPLSIFAVCRYDGWPWLLTLVMHGIFGTALWYYYGKWLYRAAKWLQECTRFRKKM
jgi:hypothetical protein